MEHALIGDARRIFAADFLGWEEISPLLVGNPPPAASAAERAALERLPFGRDQLMRAADDGMMLVLRADRTPAGKALTIAELVARFPGRAGRTKSSSEPWYARESFATEETCRPGWALVDKGPSSRSRNLCYPEQDEELQNRSHLLGLPLRRRTAVEIVYDTLLYAAVRGERLLEADWDWSSSATSDGGFVTVGQFDEQGLHLVGYSQAVRFDSLGVCATAAGQV
ncbi:MAG TPA: hypothetical protein VLF14_06125 [Candidatus Binatia bacterium]|nr:hypothetical protein [Candidatus Binatia bacterium]